MVGVNPFWVLLRTHPQREKFARDNVANWLECETFLPLFLERKKVKVLFPSYLFVRVQRWSRALLSAYGVSSVVGINGMPSRVPDGVVSDLRGRADADGLVRLDEAPEFAVGQRLRIDHGPFSGRLCLYQGMSGAERVLVLLDCFGRSNAVILDRVAVRRA